MINVDYIIEYIQFVELKYNKLTGKEKKDLVIKHILLTTKHDENNEELKAWLSSSIDLFCSLGLKKLKKCC